MVRQIKNPKSGQVRIIGGQWRGRKILFPDLPEIRPTPDRIRETLFNWLMHDIQGAHCLDLFAGSGALGFEALSRGAASVLMIDQSAAATGAIIKNAEKLNTNRMVCRCLQLPTNISSMIEQPVDVVFIDPPFREGWIAKCAQWLESLDILADNTLFYVETEKELTPLPVPANWQVLKHKTAGQTAYYLIKRDNENVK